MTDATIIHVLPVTMADRPGWLLFAPRKISPWTTSLPVGHSREDCTWDRRVRSWWIGEEFLDLATVAVESAMAATDIVYCADCVHGNPCNRFDEQELAQAGYTIMAYDTRPGVEDTQPSASDWEKFFHDAVQTIFPKKTDDATEAAALLGVRWPGATKEEVVKAFRKCASSTHPDHGGSAAAFDRVVRARATLERAIGG